MYNQKIPHSNRKTKPPFPFHTIPFVLLGPTFIKGDTDKIVIPAQYTCKTRFPLLLNYVVSLNSTAGWSVLLCK